MNDIKENLRKFREAQDKKHSSCSSCDSLRQQLKACQEELEMVQDIRLDLTGELITLAAYLDVDQEPHQTFSERLAERARELIQAKEDAIRLLEMANLSNAKESLVDLYAAFLSKINGDDNG